MGASLQSLALAFNGSVLVLPDGFYASNDHAMVTTCLNNDIKILQEVNDSWTIYEEAQLVSAPFVDYCENLKDKLPKGCFLKCGDDTNEYKYLIKQWDSLLRKINSPKDCNGNPAHIGDVLRMKIVIPTGVDAQETLKVIRSELWPNNKNSILANEYQGRVALLKDRFKFPHKETNYSSLSANIWLPVEKKYFDYGNGIIEPRGHIAEIQIVLECLEEFYKPTHKLIEEIRVIETQYPDEESMPSDIAIKKQNLTETIIVINHIAKERNGLNELIDNNIRSDHINQMDKLTRIHTYPHVPKRITTANNKNSWLSEIIQTPYWSMK